MEVITRLRKTGIPLVRRILTRALEHDPTLLANPELHKKNPDMYRHRVLSPSDMRLVWSTHLLAPLLRRAPVSCLLALDEEQAAAFFYWLTAMNITIPAELSLLSIGNSENLSPLPVSSIDPGYDHLGYLAFHAILDDIPVRVRRGNHLCGAVSLVDRGSLGSSTGLRDTGRLRGEIR
jgi:hypothetical protein